MLKDMFLLAEIMNKKDRKKLKNKAIVSSLAHFYNRKLPMSLCNGSLCFCSVMLLPSQPVGKNPQS